MFENWALRRIYRPKRDEGTGESRKLRNEELNDLYCSANIVCVIKSRRMRWAGRVGGRGAYAGIWWAVLKERNYLEDPGIDGRIILN